MLGDIEPLAEAGFAIHWLHPRSKAPIGKKWSERPVARLSKLIETYKDGNNVGVRLGRPSKVRGSYLHVIDLDIRDDERRDVALGHLRELFPDVDSWPSVISGSGGSSRHFYFLTDRPFSSKKLAHSADKYQDIEGKWHWCWEIELFGTGKQVAMPPSIHPDTGKPYRWERPFDFDMVDMGIGPFVDSNHVSDLTREEPEQDDLGVVVGDESSQPLGLSIAEAKTLIHKLPEADYREDRDGWLTVGMALHHEFGGSDEAFKLWCSFSKESEKFDKKDQRRVWRSFKSKAKPVRMATLSNAVREAAINAEFENLGETDDDDFEDLDVGAGRDDDFDDLIGEADDVEEDEPSPREVKLRKADKEADLGHVPPRVARLNKRHAVAFVSGKTVIITEKEGGLVEYGTPGDLHAFYENERVATDKATEPVTKAWMRHKKRRQYPNGIVFAPNQDRDGYYNLWRGFAVEPDPSGSCKLILSHLKNIICGGDEERYQYALHWFAHMVQFPEVKPGVAMILRGKKRIGKDTIADYIGALFPENHIKIANQDQLTGKFNAHQQKCLLLHVEEGFWAGSKNAEGVLKNLITSEKVFIEPKGLNGFSVSSVLRLFMSSNEEWVVPATADEGRYFVLEVSDARRSDHAYFGAIRKERDNGGKEALLHYLLNLDLSDFNVRDYPNTEALGQQKIQSLRNVERFWFEILEAGVLDVETLDAEGQEPADWAEEPVSIDREEFRDIYETWIRGHRFEGGSKNASTFGKLMKTMLPSLASKRKTDAGSRSWAYVFPSLPDARQQMEEYLQSAVTWTSDLPDIEEESADAVDDFEI